MDPEVNVLSILVGLARYHAACWPAAKTKQSVIDNMKNVFP